MLQRYRVNKVPIGPLRYQKHELVQDPRLMEGNRCQSSMHRYTQSPPITFATISAKSTSSTVLWRPQLRQRWHRRDNWEIQFKSSCSSSLAEELQTWTLGATLHFSRKCLDNQQVPSQLQHVADRLTHLYFRFWLIPLRTIQVLASGQVLRRLVHNTIFLVSQTSHAFVIRFSPEPVIVRSILPI